MKRDDLITEICQLAGELSGVQARLLDKIAEAHAERVWEGDGATSCAAWLTAFLGVSNHTAGSWTTTATALADLPATKTAFAAGSLTYDQVRTVCRFATAESDQDLADTAPWMSVRQLSRIAREHELVDLDSLNEAYKNRTFKYRHDEPRRTLFFGGQMPDDWGEVFITSLERIVQTTPHDPELGTYNGGEPRFADALYQMASQSLGADADPDRATVVVHVPVDVLSADAEGNGISAETALHAETVGRLACDARVQFVADNSDGIPVGIGRTSRAIPPWLARLVRNRDGGCRFPGCNHRRWVQVHHIIHWSHGGPTDLDNLITLCGYHHRLVHEQGWRISGDPSAAVIWIRKDGSVYTPTSIERDLSMAAGIWATLAEQQIRGSAASDTS